MSPGSCKERRRQSRGWLPPRKWQIQSFVISSLLLLLLCNYSASAAASAILSISCRAFDWRLQVTKCLFIYPCHAVDGGDMTRGTVPAPNTEKIKKEREKRERERENKRERRKRQRERQEKTRQKRQVGEPPRGSFAINRLWNKNQQQQPWEVFQELLPTEPMVPLTLLLEDGDRTRPMLSKDDFDYRVFLRDHFAVAHPSYYLMETENPFIMLAYHNSTQLLCVLCSLHRRDIHLPHLVVETIRTFL